MLSIRNEFSNLRAVIVGLGAPYQRDRQRVAAEMEDFPFVPDTERKAEVLALTYPTEALLEREYADFVATLERHGVGVLRPDPGAAYSFDYTCPRDIGFVVDDIFFVANMAVPSRVDEIDTIRAQLGKVAADRILRPPADCLLEGGDVVALDARILLVGFNRRSNRAGYEFLRDYLAPRGMTVLPVPHRQLHLDCCLNPLGGGHLLIHPPSLDAIDAATRRALEAYTWIEVDSLEREQLATNVLSIGPETVVARDHPACARVNRVLGGLGYTIDTVGFDGVPATGGSFRCATLPLARA